MIIEKILERLDGVRTTGNSTWIARCPAHDDKNPSMTLREADDGRVLMHCFSGCPVEHIVASVGLEMTDLFPDSRETHKPVSRPLPAADVLRCINQDLYLMHIYARQMAHGAEMTAGDRSQMADCAHRIAAAIEVARV